MVSSHRSGTPVVSGVHGAPRVGRRSLVALTGLIVAVTLVCGLGGVSTSVAAAAVPSYAWATQGGGTGIVRSVGVSALPDGSSIITGIFTETATFGGTTLTSVFAHDTFTAKVNADGSFAWAIRGGGTGNDFASDVSALPDGSSIITGVFTGIATFETTGGTTILTNTKIGWSNFDTFTAKVNADGSFAWATQSGGTGSAHVSGVSALADGSSIITGNFEGIATFETTILESDGNDTFTAKLNANGSFAWAIRGGGAGNDFASDVSALADGSSIITGFFNGTATFGDTILTNTKTDWSGDTFTAKVNADGSFAWATQSGGTGSASANGVSALADGSSIIIGNFSGEATFETTGGTTILGSDGTATFTAKLNANGTYAWVIQNDGTGNPEALGVSALADGSSIITGNFEGIATFGSTTLTSSAGSYDTFTVKVNADGSFAWAIQNDGTGNDIARGVSALADGSSIITGYFNGEAIFGSTTLTSAESDAAFTARIVADVPQAPTGASASSGIRAATITWNAVAGGLVSSYTATASPGGASCTAVAPTVTCTITNLTAGTSYTATVTATNPQGTSPASRASNAVTPTGVAVTPVNTFTMKLLKSSARFLTTQLNLPGPGIVVQVGTTRLSTPRATEMAKRAGTMIVCRARKTVAKAGKLTIICRLTKKARAARKTQSLTVRLVTTFTPTGGTAKSVTRTLVLKKTQYRPEPVTG